MSDHDILKENKRLQFLVEELKREIRLMARTIEMGTQFTEHLMEKHRAMIAHARELIQKEHEMHCVSCSAHAVTDTVSEQGDVTFTMIPEGGGSWGAN